MTEQDKEAQVYKCLVCDEEAVKWDSRKWVCTNCGWIYAEPENEKPERKIDKIKKVIFIIKKDDTKILLDKYYLSFKVVSYIEPKESTNQRLWIFIKGTKYDSKPLFNYLLINCSISIVFESGNILKTDGYIEDIRPQDNDTILLVLNYLYAFETLEFIEAENKNDKSEEIKKESGNSYCEID